ncbi:MAG: ABC transporter substrate-binding protein [Coriobacteriia bacterium]|nr:ABC transporter substrate-binding protein [Coriobacteriia bacterium]
MNQTHADAQCAQVTRRIFCRWLGGGLLVTLAATALPGCKAADQFFTGERTITDDAGRQLKIPTVSKLKRIYFTSSLAQIFCFTLAPDLIAGTGLQFTKKELKYLPKGTADLPYMGTLSGGAEIDREALLVEDVQVIFSISGVALTKTNISEAQDLQTQTNIPVVVIDGSFDRIAQAYRLLGEVLGQEKRAEELASYCEKVYSAVTEAITKVPSDRRVSLYYAEGPEGLQTEPDVSEHALTFAVAGANNVAAVPETQGLGMSNVSLEQVLKWNPQVIVAWDDVVRGGADEYIRKSPDWASITAVKEGRVYTMPNAPYAWCDRPPGVNRLVGIQWVANMLYPDAYDVDMVEEVKKFYAKFYWVDVTDADVKELLGNSYPPYRA